MLWKVVQLGAVQVGRPPQLLRGAQRAARSVPLGGCARLFLSRLPLQSPRAFWALPSSVLRLSNLCLTLRCSIGSRRGGEKLVMRES